MGSSWTYDTYVDNQVRGETRMEVATRNVAGSEVYVIQLSFQGQVVAEKCMGWEGTKLITYQGVSNRQI